MCVRERESGMRTRASVCERDIEMRKRERVRGSMCVYVREKEREKQNLIKVSVLGDSKIDRECESEANF